MENKQEISVVVVTFNNESSIKQCLESLRESSSIREVLVVDNNSVDQTINIVKSFKQVVLIKLKENIGFAKACNLAASKASGDYLFLLNPDTEALDKSLDILLDYLRQHPSVGIVAPQLVMPSGKPQPSVRKLPTLIGLVREYYLQQKSSYSEYVPSGIEPVEVESVYGAAMLIKKNVFQQLGGFNEKYFLYYEDLDFCRRVRSNSLKVVYNPQAKVRHEIGQSSKTLTFKKPFFGLRTIAHFLPIKTMGSSYYQVVSGNLYHGIFKAFIFRLLIYLASKMRFTSMFWILLIFLVSSVFRIFFMDLIEFKADEANTIFQIEQFFDSPYLIQRGLISGIGVHNLPLFSYLMVPIATFSRHPQYLSFIIALINTILVAIFYLFVRKYYGHLTAVFAAIFLAFSPWGVIFSRKIWAQDLIFLLFLPLLWLLHELIIKKNIKVTLPIFVLLMFLLQLHGSGLFLLVATFVIFLTLRVKVDIKSVLVGTSLGLIPSIPYLLFQLNSGCPDCEAFLEYQNSIRSFDIYNLIRPFQVMNGLGYHFVLGADYANFASTFPLTNLLKYIFLLSFLILPLGVMATFLKSKQHFFLSIYVIIIPALYLLTKTTAYMHYFVIIIPIVALLYATSLNYLYNFSRGVLLKILSISILFVLVAANVIFISFFYQFLELKKDIKGDYGPIFLLTERFVQEETDDYKFLPYYGQLKSYAYIYATQKNFHSKLANFFLGKGEYDLAETEQEKNLR